MQSNLMNDAMNPVHRFFVLLAEDVFGVSQSVAGDSLVRTPANAAE